MLTHSKIIETSLRDQGGTFDAQLYGNAKLPNFGYMVGLAKVAEITANSEGHYDRNEITRHLDAAILQATSFDQVVYIGTWVDNGIFYIDLSERLEDELSSIRLCRERDELAYWDIAKSESIDVKQPIKLQGLTAKGQQQ